MRERWKHHSRASNALSKREEIVVAVSAADRVRLEAVVADRNSPQKHVWRARIVLLSADGHGTCEIMRRTAKSKTGSLGGSRKTFDRQDRLQPVSEQLGADTLSQ